MIYELELENFRSHKKSFLTFNKGLNLIVGKNGAGKTSILEACELNYKKNIFSKANLEDLISVDSRRSIIKSKLNLNDEIISINLELIPNMLSRSINPVAYKRSIGKFQNIVTLCREDFELVSKEQDSKRSYLDEGSSILFGENFSKIKKDFLKAKKNRSQLLKNEKIDLKSFQIWTDIYDNLTKEIRDKRRMFIEELHILIPDLVLKVFGKILPIEIKYEESLKPEDPKKEFYLKTNLYGPQRDKMIVFFDNKDYRSQLSIGERKAIVYILKTALMLASIEKKVEPIFFVDDFSSELDAQRRAKIIELLLQYSTQVFITTTQSVEFDEYFHKSSYNLIEI